MVHRILEGERMVESESVKEHLADLVIGLAIIGGLYFQAAFLTTLLVIELSKAGWTILP